MKLSLPALPDQIFRLIQRAPKKMHHSDLYPISVLEVRIYFFSHVQTVTAALGGFIED